MHTIFKFQFFDGIGIINIIDIFDLIDIIDNIINGATDIIDAIH